MVPTPPIFLPYSSWVFEGRFWSLITTIVWSDVAVRAAMQFLYTATERALSTYQVDDRIQIGKPLLVAISPSVVQTIN